MNDPKYTINEYYGFASWYEGQLDGEIQSSGWTIRNDVQANEVFGDGSMPDSGADPKEEL